MPFLVNLFIIIIWSARSRALQQYRAISDLVQAQSKGKGVVEIMEVQSCGDGDEAI